MISSQDLKDITRINVVGTSGCGKSTFTKQLAEALCFDAFHMDQLYWKPNWGEPSDLEFFPIVEKALSGDKWVVDGNYKRTNIIKWKNVQLIVWLDYSFTRIFYQVVSRSIRRAITQEELWPGTGNRESFKKCYSAKILLYDGCCIPIKVTVKNIPEQ